MAGVGVLCNGNGQIISAACALLVVAQLAAAWLVKLPSDRSFWVEGYMEVSRVIPRPAIGG